HRADEEEGKLGRELIRGTLAQGRPIPIRSDRALKEKRGTRRRPVSFPWARLALTEVALDALLVLFAANAERGLGARLEALRSDLRPTLFAESEGSILDAIEGFLNLAQKDLFTAAEAEGER